MCPEMLVGAGYNEKADVWSFAAIVYALLFGTFPYVPKKQSSAEMKAVIVSGNPPPSFEPVERIATANTRKHSADAMSFVKTMLDRDPAQRPSAAAALDLPWMSAALQGCHMPGADLQSLRPALHAARRAGAFELRDCVKEAPLDPLLGALQEQRHGIPLPRQPSLPRELVKQPPRAEKEQKRSSNSKASTKDHWDNASNPSTTGSDANSVFSGSIFSGWSKGTDPMVSF
jgi:serine/threonine protein kinase